MNKETFCISLIRKVITKYYANVKIKYVTDNKQFWKTIKTCLSDKSKTSEKTIPIKYDKMATLNNFFSSIVTSSDIPKFKDCNPLSERNSTACLKCHTYVYKPS